MRSYKSGLSGAAVVLALTVCVGAQSPSPGTWTIVPQNGGDLGLKFSLGWTLGTHEGQASRVTGSMQAQTEPLAIVRGEFRVPIAAMSTGSTTRDCHMREALGINYQGSRFPGDHVCVNDQVPATGPDSVVFPDIVIGVRGLNQPAQASSLRLAGTQPVNVQVSLSMSIHGVTRDVIAPLRLQLIAPDTVQAQTEFDLKLADFAIVVVMPRLMKVDDHIKVKLHLLLRKS